MGKIRAKVIVEGRVQGVFFRDSTRRKARELQVEGFVRNLYDGRVEAVLEGDENMVNEVIDFMKEGPEYAHVSKAEVSYHDYRGEFGDFYIERSSRS